MAAKCFDSSDIKTQEELNDMTTCCICTEVFTDPKALPCLHAFCMKCIQETGLKINKGPGDEMPCPVCRQLFKIPTGGFNGLTKYFLMERLVKVANPNQSASSRVLCDVCFDDDEKEADNDIPDADTYCVECKQKFCRDCDKHHRKQKKTKRHKSIPIDEHEVYIGKTTNITPNVCELHENKLLDVYCADCKTVVCALCFFENHNNHKGSRVDKCVADLKKSLQKNIEPINDCIFQAQMKKAEFLQAKEEIQQRMVSLQRDIARRSGDLKRFADKHAKVVIQSLRSAVQRRHKEIQLATDDIDAYLGSIESYNSYFKRITEKGSESDICGAFSDLSIKALELQEQCPAIIQPRIQDFKIFFRVSDLQTLLQEDGENLIGEIEESDDCDNPKKLNKESPIAECITEIEPLEKEMEIESEEKEDLLSAYEELRVRLSQERQQAEEIKKETDNHEAHIKELEHELENNNTHQINHDKLEQELDKQKNDNTSLQYENDNLKQQLDTEMTSNITLQTINDKLQQEFDQEKSNSRTVQANNEKLVQEVISYKTTIRTLEDSIENLKQESESAQTGHMTNEELKEKFRRNYVRFVSDVDPDELGDHLKQDGVVSIDQWAFITAQKSTAKEKSRAIFDFLLSHTHPSAFLTIRAALENKDHVHHLLKTITKKDIASAQELKTELEDGRPLAASKPESTNPLVVRYAEVEHTHIAASKEIISFSQGQTLPREEEELLMLRQNNEEQFLNIDMKLLTQKIEQANKEMP